jgi:hypothetical protein
MKQETDIINDILLQIVSDKHFLPLTPPPPAERPIRFDKLKVDSTENNYAREYKKFESKLDTNRFVITIEDSTDIDIDKSLITENLKERGYNDLVGIRDKSNKKLNIEIDKIKNSGRFELIKRGKQFPKGLNFRRYKGFDLTFYYFGNISFSRPFLNDSRDYGYVIYKRECGFECDQDYILIIKKLNNKWTIKDKIYAR